MPVSKLMYVYILRTYVAMCMKFKYGGTYMYVCNTFTPQIKGAQAVLRA